MGLDMVKLPAHEPVDVPEIIIPSARPIRLIGWLIVAPDVLDISIESDTSLSIVIRSRPHAPPAERFAKVTERLDVSGHLLMGVLPVWNFMSISHGPSKELLAAEAGTGDGAGDAGDGVTGTTDGPPVVAPGIVCKGRGGTAPHLCSASVAKYC